MMEPDVIESAFPRIAAYQTMKLVPSERIRQTNWSFLQKRLGDLRFNKLMDRSQVRIASIHLECLYDESKAMKSLKVSGRANAAEILKTINSYWTSDLATPSRMQPLGSMKTFLTQLQSISSQISQETVVLLLRNVLDQYNKSLDTLRGVGELRKLRLIAALFDTQCCRGYPLQMTILGLLPSLKTAVVSTEDVMGLMYYLLSEKTKSLDHSPCLWFTSMALLLRAEEESQARYGLVLGTGKSRFTTWVNKRFETAQSPPSGSILNVVRLMIGECQNVSSISYEEKWAIAIDQVLSLQHTGPSNGLDSYANAILLYKLGTCFSLHSPKTVRLVKSICNLIASIDGGFESDVQLFIARVKAYNIVMQDDSQASEIVVVGSCKESDDRPIQESLVLRLTRELRSEHLMIISTAERVLRSISKTHRQFCTALPTEYGLLPEDLLPVIPLDQAPSALSASDLANNDMPFVEWTRTLATALTLQSDMFYAALQPILQASPQFTLDAMPHLIQAALLNEAGLSHLIRNQLGRVFDLVFQDYKTFSKDHIKLLIDVIEHLKKCKSPKMKTPYEQNFWLPFDYDQAALAAAYHGFLESSILFIQISWAVNKILANKDGQTTTLLRDIYARIWEPDSFYGVKVQPNLESVLRTYEYEGNGWKTVPIRSGNAHKRSATLS